MLKSIRAGQSASTQQVSTQPRAAASVRLGQLPSSEVGEGDLTAMLRSNLEKINKCVELQWEVIMGELKTRLRTADTNPDSLAKLGEDIVTLDSFVRTNFTGFRKITKKCDKHIRTSFGVWFQACVVTASFRYCDFDLPLGQLGILYRMQRQGVERGGGADVQLAAEAKEHVETFLVPPCQLMRVKAELLRVLQPLGSSTGVPAVPGVVAAASPRRASRQAGASQANRPLKQHLTHVYFDNAAADQYHQRLARQLGRGSSGPLFRCQWVGQKADPDVALDVKLGTGEPVRVHLKHREITALVDGKLDPETVSCDVGSQAQEAEPGGVEVAFRRVVTAVAESALRPTVAVIFDRTSFAEDSGGNDVKVLASLDEDLVFSNEGSEPSWLRSSWEKAASSRPAKEQKQRSVPMEEAVLRVYRTRSGDVSTAVRQLLEQLVAEGALRPVSGFSKGLYGTHLLYEDGERPPPPWLQANGSNSATRLVETRLAGAGEVSRSPVREEAAGAGKAVSQRPPEQEAPTGPQATPLKGVRPSMQVAFRGLCRPFSFCWRHISGALHRWKGTKESQPQKLRVDPKTPMANERTLLRWLRSAAFLTTLSAFLASQSDSASQLNALLLAFVSLLFVFWPLFMFCRRSHDISSASALSRQPKVDRALPQALALSLVVILLAVLLIQAVFESSARPEPEIPAAGRESL